MFDKTYIGSDILGEFEAPPALQSWSRVTIQVDEDTTYTAGSDTGRTLTISNPWGTQQMAEDILARLLGRSHQAYSAENVLLDPAAELGDAVENSSLYGGLYHRVRKLEQLYNASISAPGDEEIDHEYPYKSAQTRVVERKFKETKASLQILSDRILAEVAAREKDNEEIRGTLEVQAGQIAAKVEKTGGNASSFGWTLDEKSWKLQANGSTVLTADKNGLDIVGRIRALSGSIGGFEIEDDYLSYNGQTWGGTNTYGAYIGSNGIQLGRDFKVDMSGDLVASSGRFEGTVYAGSIDYGGSAGYFNGGGIDSGTVYGSKIASSTLGTSKFTSGVNTSLDYGDYAYGAVNGWNDIAAGDQGLTIGGHLIIRMYKEDIGNYLSWY